MAALGQALMVAGLVILCFPGVIFNNMIASGYAQAGEPNLTCPGNGDVTCHGSVAVGCQAFPSACTLSGASISFLNQKSPFTQLIQGNIFGFFTGLTNTGTGLQGGRGPFDSLGGLFYNVDCYVTKGIDGHQTNAAIGHCTQTTTDNKNVTEPNAVTWQNWNQNQSGVVKNLQLYRLGNGTFPMTCSWNAQINYTAIANGPGWTYFGCDVTHGTNVITNATWSILIAMPVSAGGITTGHYHLWASLRNSDFDSGQGPSLAGSAYYNSQFENWFNGFKGILISGSPFSNQYFVPSINGPVVSWLVGIVLFIIGLGLNFAVNGTFFGTGGGVSAGVNRQGTKLAQVLGIGLMIYSPFYSEFSVWFTSGYLPYGLDGATGIISILVAIVFFSGVIWWATQD